MLPKANPRSRVTPDPIQSADIWMAAMTGHHGTPPRSLQMVIANTFEPFDQQAANAYVDDENLLADGYRRHQSYKRSQKNPIRYSTLDLQGTLTVTNSEKLRAALLRGIGAAKAFGCGLLLVRRA